MGIAFIVNPMAQAGQARQKWGEMLPAVRKHFPEAIVILTEGPGDATKKVRVLIQGGGIKTFVAVGGDGTINEVVNGFFNEGDVRKELLSPDLSLGVISLGTGGDFVRSLRLGKTFEENLGIIAQGYERPMDLCEARFEDFERKPRHRVFINMATTGLGGLTVLLVSKKLKKLGGRISFLLGALEAMVRYRPRVISVGDESGTLYSENSCLVAIANSEFCGGGMNMAKGTPFDDGKLLVVAIPWKLRLLCLFPLIYFGWHLRLRSVRTFMLEEFHLRSDGHDTTLELDGEALGYLPLTARVMKHAIRVIEKAPA